MQRRRPRHLRRCLPGVAVALLLTGCASAGEPGRTDPAGVDGLEVPTPSPDPADFVTRVDNPYFPLRPGSAWAYESTGSEGGELITVTVTDQERVVAGVETVVVHEEVTDATGELVEDTFDWFAQDTAGNVWYFGEDTTSYDDGEPSTEGSWEAGVDGAMAGIVMLAKPRIGDGYQQELRTGVAEDVGEVLDTDAQVDLDLESYDDVVVVADTTPLEPDLEEHKYYAPKVGLVAEATVRGGDEQVVLVSFESG